MKESFDFLNLSAHLQQYLLWHGGIETLRISVKNEFGVTISDGSDNSLPLWIIRPEILDVPFLL